MAGTKSETKGKKNKVVGGVKKETGRVTKNRKLEAKGAAQKGKGSVQDTAGKTARKVSKYPRRVHVAALNATDEGSEPWGSSSPSWPSSVSSLSCCGLCDGHRYTSVDQLCGSSMRVADPHRRCPFLIRSLC